MDVGVWKTAPVTPGLSKILSVMLNTKCRTGLKRDVENTILNTGSKTHLGIY